MATLVNISIKGYTEAGHEAAFDFTAASDNVQAEMIDAMNQLWLAGVTPNLPGWIQRHDFEACDTVLLREQENTDGSRTPIVTMYAVKPYLNHKFLHEYLNTADDVRAFEALIGRSLQGMPLYPGTTSPERGKRQQDAQYFVKVKPFGVLKRIPEAGESDETREKHRLVRYIPITNSSAPSQPTPPASSKPAPVERRAVQPTPAQVIDAALDLGSAAPAVNPFNGQPATQQPMIGVDGKRTEADITKLCGDFYAWANKTYKQFDHNDLHNILEVDSAKDYFATHSLGDAKTEVTNFAKGLQKAASGQ